MSVLVTDGNERAALAVTRALGREGVEVVVGAEGAPSLAGASRFCRHTVCYPSPYKDPVGFIEALLRVIKERKIRVLIPLSDMAMSLVGDARGRFDRVTVVPAPPKHAYDVVSDKYRLMRLAHDEGVPIPATIFVPDGVVPESLSAVGPFPLVIKPSKSRMNIDGRWIATSVQVVRNREELTEAYHRTPYLRLPSLIQERIEGEGRGVFALFDRGKPVTVFAHRRLREKPPSGGVSVLRESITPPRDMAEHAVQLLEKVGWHGVAMVEFKVDPRTGLARLMEINGRFWGSLQLAVDAGVNFPWLLYQLATGQPVQHGAIDYQSGVQSRWLLGDLDHLLARLLKSEHSLKLPRGYPSRWQCFMDFIQLHGRRRHCEVERWDDLGPARVEWSAYIKSLIGVTV